MVDLSIYHSCSVSNLFYKYFNNIIVISIFIFTYIFTFLVTMSSYTEIKECPICMDAIQLNINCVTTECGHLFHTNCLMKNIACNGFGCPYCRTMMADEVEDVDESEYDEEEEEDEEDEHRRDVFIQAELDFNNTIREERVLGGLRWLFNRANNEETVVFNKEDDDTIQFWRQNGVQEEDEDDDERPIPSVEFITNKLQSQGVTMEKLVKCMLIDHEEYAYNEDIESELNLVDDELFGKLRIIITNYVPEQEIKKDILLMDNYYQNRFINVI